MKINQKYDELMGKRIRDLREKKNLSLREAGDRIGLDYSYLGRVERGFIPSTKVIKNIAEYYQVDISYLMGEEVDVPSELKNKIQSWRTVIEESERRGYTPEDIENLLITIDLINKKQ